MQSAETVTFGSSGLDRAAHLRGDPAALAALGDARVILFWRGKPLLEKGETALARLRPDHPVLPDDAHRRVFLGLDEAGPVFAQDLPNWVPDPSQDAPTGAFMDPTIQRHPACDDAEGFVELRACMTALSPRDAELAAMARAVLGWHRTHGFCAACGAETEMSMSGWQRACATCGAHHFPRTDPVVIMLVTHGSETLLGRGKGWPEGLFSCLAGFVEPGETVEAAVRREVFEETRVRVGPVSYLSSQPWAFPSSLMIGCRAEATSRDITIDPVELEEARWVGREELMRAFAGDHPDLQPARQGAIARFLMMNWLADRLD